MNLNSCTSGPDLATVNIKLGDADLTLTRLEALNLVRVLCQFYRFSAEETGLESLLRELEQQPDETEELKHNLALAVAFLQEIDKGGYNSADGEAAYLGRLAMDALIKLGESHCGV